MTQRLTWQRLLSAIDIVSLTLVAYLCAGIWWQVVESQLAGTLAAPEVSPSSVRQNQPVSPAKHDLGVVLQRNLFSSGGSASSPDSEQARIDALAATSLNLQLLGTVAVTGSDGRVEPWAVILDKSSGKQDVYHQGDIIAQATIRKILRAKVVLGVQGRDEILAMDMNPRGGGAVRGSNAGGGTGNRIELNRQELQGAMANMSSILSQVEIKPVAGDNGASSGFSLDRIAGGSLFDKIGLQNGDVIQGANGKAVTSPDDAFAIYQGLKNQSRVSLTILRNGKPETVNVHIK